ncbi:unnamed protein product [Caenorhabditis angaria]|uniref:Uncharacterized protein n=1 Tax=Caenorhabditis angaria TaxID=860376 RepID=A0A9P1IT81_9PELO|nr:unnamed protein product [Caenorhabditis angaria]
MIFLVFTYGSTWMLIIAIWMWPDESTRQKLNQYFIGKYNESTENIPFIIADYQRTSEFDKNGLIGMGLATVVSIVSLLIDAFLAAKIYLALKNLNLSNNVKKMHRNLLITLIAQTIIPTILTFIPCLLIWFVPLLNGLNNFDISYYLNSICVPMLCAYPIIDPLIITFALVDYREVICQKFRKFQPRATPIFPTMFRTTLV